jgi:sacsin
MDGVHRSVGDGPAFIDRDDFEKALFSLDDSRNLDIEKLSATTQLALRQACESPAIHPNICYRTAISLREYCARHIFKTVPQNQDMVVLDGESSAFVSKVWTWIEMRKIHPFHDNISCLWLLPLSNGHHRKIKPSSSSFQIYFAPAGETGELMRELDSKSSRKPLPLLHTSLLSSNSVLSLLESPRAASDLFIESGSSIVAFVKWLHGTYPRLDDVSDKHRQQIAKLIASNLPDQFNLSERTILVSVLRHMKIFEKVSWNLVKGKMFVTLLLPIGFF